jgi:hypothetical protein
VLPNGDPATNATVFLCHARGGVYMDEPGKFRKGPSNRLRVQPDKHGHFSFATVLDARGFIVIDDYGYAEVPISSFSGHIVLQPWGRIEGKLMIGAQAGKGKTVWVTQPLNEPFGTGKLSLGLSIQTTTDNDGNFVFEKVPPGERVISERLIPATNGTDRIFYSQEKTLSVSPGVVTRVELGGSGRLVTGRASFTGESADRPIVGVELSAKGQGVEREKHYSAYCSADGSFSIPDVPPGRYELAIDFRREISGDPINIADNEAALLNKEINVPESEDGKDHEVFDLGRLDVPAVKANGNAGMSAFE